MGLTYVCNVTKNHADENQLHLENLYKIAFNFQCHDCITLLPDKNTDIRQTLAFYIQFQCFQILTYNIWGWQLQYS